MVRSESQSRGIIILSWLGTTERKTDWPFAISLHSSSLRYAVLEYFPHIGTDFDRVNLLLLPDQHVKLIIRCPIRLKVPIRTSWPLVKTQTTASYCSDVRSQAYFLLYCFNFVIRIASSRSIRQDAFRRRYMKLVICVSFETTTRVQCIALQLSLDWGSNLRNRTLTGGQRGLGQFFFGQQRLRCRCR